jgi:hypothetical protein
MHSGRDENATLFFVEFLGTRLAFGEQVIEVFFAGFEFV